MTLRLMGDIDKPEIVEIFAFSIVTTLIGIVSINSIMARFFSSRPLFGYFMSWTIISFISVLISYSFIKKVFPPAKQIIYSIGARALLLGLVFAGIAKIGARYVISGSAPTASIMSISQLNTVVSSVGINKTTVTGIFMIFAISALVYLISEYIGIDEKTGAEGMPRGI